RRQHPQRRGAARLHQSGRGFVDLRPAAARRDEPALRLQSGARLSGACVSPTSSFTMASEVALTRTLIGSLTVLGFVVALTACKTDGSGNDVGIIAEPIPEEELPEQSAGALCELIFGCSCESPNYPDEPSCVETRSDLLNQEQLAAQAAGLTYDAQCAGDLLALAEADGCATQVALDCDTFCAAYHGDLGVDQPCM